MDERPLDEQPEQPEQPERPLETRTLYRHPLAAVGGALILAGALAFVVLFIVDATAQIDNPYRSLITFVAIPALITLGIVVFLIAVRVQVVGARRRGERVRFVLKVEPSDPHYMRNLWLFLGLGALLLVVVAYTGFKAYETTDSVAFCGSACHEVMGPQNVTYANSPHARVPCVDCHIGPGGSFWVKSKIDGVRQVWAVLTNHFDRPIETPVANLRPAQETCEGCHWPEVFFGRKLITTTYYRTDEANSAWTISLLMNIGGGNPWTGELEGIHWHMLAAQDVEYIATDEKRQDIAWVRVVDNGGEPVATYTYPDAAPIEPDDPAVAVRLFDCMDCHNRPSHAFAAPATAINLELSKRTISKDLPYIRRIGVEVLNAPYETKQEARAAIPARLLDFYEAEYPDQVDELRPLIDQAAGTLTAIYNANYFPDMKTDYRARADHLSHFVDDGCFRCHFTAMENERGERISSSCEGCHSIVAQGPSDGVEALASDINGLPFVHPVNIGQVWQTLKCTQCHTPASGY